MGHTPRGNIPLGRRIHRGMSPEFREALEAHPTTTTACNDHTCNAVLVLGNPWRSRAEPNFPAHRPPIQPYLVTYRPWPGGEPTARCSSSSMHRSSCHMSHSRLLHPRKLPGPNVAIRPCSDVGAPLRLYAMSSDLQFVQRPVRRTRKRVCPSLRHPLLLPVLTSA